MKTLKHTFFKYLLAIASCVGLMSTVTHAQSLDNQTINGYRGIWFSLGQFSQYGDKYSGGLGTYTADHIPLAIYAPEVQKTFFVYGGVDESRQSVSQQPGWNDVIKGGYLLCMAGSYDHRTGTLSKPVVVYDKKGVCDPHDNPSIAMDDEGYIWVFVSGRGRGRLGRIYKSSKPYSVESFDFICEDEVTYPQPKYVKGKGFLHLFTKYTGVRLLYFSTSKDGKEWTEHQQLVAMKREYDANGGHYQVSGQSGEKIGFFFNWHPNGDPDKRTNLYYMQSRDFGKTWETVTEEKLSIPVTNIDSPTMAKEFFSKGKNVYIQDMAYDENNHPVALYSYGTGHQPGPHNGLKNWCVTRWNGSKWETYQITTSDHNYDTGSLWIENGKWTVVGPTANGPQVWGTGGEVVIWESTDHGKTWNCKRQVTHNSTLNHSYVRKVVNGVDPFKYFWADGDPEKPSKSHLYYGDSEGNYHQMPYDMSEKPAQATTSSLLNAYRLPPPPVGFKPTLEDLNKDGRPDVIHSLTRDNTPVLWIDDDGDMTWESFEGDTDNDCLLIDRNRDGKYGSYGDLIIDWVAVDKDGNPAMQLVVDNVKEGETDPNAGHYMWMIDSDRDNVFNYIDWNTFTLRCWLHNGLADFYEDYHGNVAFLKAHATPDRVNNTRLNWENPFLFYDPDKDGLTEYTIRFCDAKSTDPADGSRTLFAGRANWAALSVDLDNDNRPGEEFDLDFTVQFSGRGFDYTAHRQTNRNLSRRLPETDTYFLAPRWRQMTELTYANHEEAPRLMFDEGDWQSASFTFDEDDDCNRWERVELYLPQNLFGHGYNWNLAAAQNLAGNPQADPAGDRGEWDADNSGRGNLYVGAFDSRLHLYGAEWGAWRIDQNARYYQGMGGIHDGYGPDRIEQEPTAFATVKYTDTNGNGFIDRMEYDLDGDTHFEDTLSMLALGIDDRCSIIETKNMDYKDFTRLMDNMANRAWKNAQKALNVAHRYGLNTSWYARMKQPKSTREKYDYGYWLQFYLYRDLLDALQRKQDSQAIDVLKRAYLTGDWDSVSVSWS